jgi:hypothetical protein
MNIRFHSLVLTSVFVLATAGLLRAEPALLGNKGLAGQTLDGDAVKAVLTGKKASLGGTRVILVIIKASAAQDAFLNTHTGMTTDQFNTYWRRLYMTGGGSAPKTVETEDEACKLVAETPGAIAIIDSAKTGDLTVLAGK